MSVYLISDTTIALPNPALSDVDQGLSTISLKRSINGKRYTYKTTKNRRRKLWAFQLTYKKYRELKSFLLLYSAKVIQVILNDNSIHRAVIRSNPTEFQTDGIAECLENLNVTLELEFI